MDSLIEKSRRITDVGSRMGKKDFDFMRDYKWLSRAGQVFGECETRGVAIEAPGMAVRPRKCLLNLAVWDLFEI